MSNVVSFSARDPAVSKQEIVDTLNRLIGEHDELKIFPTSLKIAMEERVWESERRFIDGTIIPPLSFHDFVHRKYPYGIGATYQIVENLIRDRADVLLLWTEVTKRKQGERTDLLDNIQEVPKAPTGTSREAGLRKLQKAAAEGKEKAQVELSLVIDGKKSVHRASVDAGLRKPTQVDRDVRRRCDQANAERVVAHFPHEVIEAFVSDLFAGGHTSLAKAIKNIIGESVLDGGR